MTAATTIVRQPALASYPQPTPTARAALQVEKASVDGERRKVEGDLGPVRYLATLIGASDQDILRWFILAIAMLLGPAAVLLLLCAVEKRSVHLCRHSRTSPANALAG